MKPSMEEKLVTLHLDSSLCIVQVPTKDRKGCILQAQEASSFCMNGPFCLCACHCLELHTLRQHACQDIS